MDKSEIQRRQNRVSAETPREPARAKNLHADYSRSRILRCVNQADKSGLVPALAMLLSFRAQLAQPVRECRRNGPVVGNSP